MKVDAVCAAECIVESIWANILAKGKLNTEDNNI